MKDNLLSVAGAAGLLVVGIIFGAWLAVPSTTEGEVSRLRGRFDVIQSEWWDLDHRIAALEAKRTIYVGRSIVDDDNNPNFCWESADGKSFSCVSLSALLWRDAMGEP